MVFIVKQLFCIHTVSPSIKDATNEMDYLIYTRMKPWLSDKTWATFSGFRVDQYFDFITLSAKRVSPCKQITPLKAKTWGVGCAHWCHVHLPT